MCLPYLISPDFKNFTKVIFLFVKQTFVKFRLLTVYLCQPKCHFTFHKQITRFSIADITKRASCEIEENTTSLCKVCYNCLNILIC